ncbi:hypothetical protein LA080_002005 [Diaporthe eres]|nr:hypothetical protein LA080_002005 [Diaporthe eres]
MPAPSPEMFGKNEAEGKITTAGHATDLPTPTLEFDSDSGNDFWYSHPIATAIIPEQLQILHDLSLAESKFHTKHRLDARMLGTTNEHMLLMASPEGLSYTQRYDEEQPSSGDPTPTSEAWEYWEESPELSSYNIDGEALLEVFKGPLDMLFQEWIGGLRCEDGCGDKGSSSSSPSAARSTGHQQPESKRKRVDIADSQDTDARPNKLPTRGRGGL